MENIFTASTHDNLLFFTNRGQAYVRKGYVIPKTDRTARGTNIVNILPLEPGEKVSAMLRSRGLEEDKYIMFFTRSGTVKRMRQSELRNIRRTGIRALELNEGDELIQAISTDGNDDLMMVTARGMAIRFSENDVRPMGRTAVGVRGIRLRDDDRVVPSGRRHPHHGGRGRDPGVQRRHHHPHAGGRDLPVRPGHPGRDPHPSGRGRRGGGRGPRPAGRRGRDGGMMPFSSGCPASFTRVSG